jgi:hypothetical protein
MQHPPKGPEQAFTRVARGTTHTTDSSQEWEILAMATAMNIKKKDGSLLCIPGGVRATEDAGIGKLTVWDEDGKIVAKLDLSTVEEYWALE